MQCVDEHALGRPIDSNDSRDDVREIGVDRKEAAPGDCRSGLAISSRMCAFAAAWQAASSESFCVS